MTKTPPNPEELAQSLVAHIQNLEEEILRGQQNLQLVELQLQRLLETRGAVQELKNHKAGDEMLINIGSGVHLYVTLTKPKRVITSLGAGFAAERTVEQALTRFEEQQNQLTDIAKRQQEQLQNTQARIEEYREQLNQILAQFQQQQQQKQQ
jgi:prefoldin alpha subunit